MTGTDKNDEAAKMLEEYNRKNALKNGDFKRIVAMYFEAADEYRERTGKEPAPIVFNLNVK